MARIETPNQNVRATYEQAVRDLGSLRMERVGDGWVPAAGVPWYVALFGRDSLIVAVQTTTTYCHYALGTLERLASLQGRRVDTWRDEEPGKIPHELRRGELAITRRTPHSPYYGTVDAPFLYIIALSEAFNFLGDPQVLERFLAPAQRCLDWAERYGDLDGDGFVEYLTRSPKGYRNQGWKDSWDAVVYRDGRLAEPPIALCEVQGYYYDALLRMARIYEALGRPGEAAPLRVRAELLRQRFDAAFWMEEEGYYAFGLDREKRQIDGIASNPGHLLWSGLVPPEKAARVAQRLMQPDLFCGWGVRTLSSTNGHYNPVGYHVGSVWPHDNAIIALGLKRYGLVEQCHRIAEGIFAAAACFKDHTLPELWGGTHREPYGFPSLYQEANVPQAWASGSVFMLLRAILGIEPDGLERVLHLDPALPDWLPELVLREFLVLGGRLDLRFWRDGEETRVEVLRNESAVQVVVGRRLL